VGCPRFRSSISRGAVQRTLTAAREERWERGAGAWGCSSSQRRELELEQLRRGDEVGPRCGKPKASAAGEGGQRRARRARMDRVARRVAKIEQSAGELDFLTARLAAAAGRVCRARNLLS
jgi:hypothetical protein